MFKTRLISLILLAIVLVTMWGCVPMGSSSSTPSTDDPESLSQPTHPVVLLFRGLKEADSDTVRMSAAIPSDIFTDEVNEILENPIVKTAARMMYDSLSYSVTEVLVDGNNAVVTVAVEYPDSQPYIETAAAEFAPMVVNQIAEGTFNREEFAKSLLVSLATQLTEKGGLDAVKETIDISCYQTDEGWQLSFDDALINVCTANLLNATKDVDLSFLM